MACGSSIRRRILVAGAVLLAAGPVHLAAAMAQQRRGQMPRFASLKSDEVRFRRGPSVNAPIDWVYRRRHLPVEIFEESRDWRHVRDASGTEGWVHQSLLSRRRRAMVVGDRPQNLHADSEAGSRIRARLRPGVIGDVTRCNDAFCRLRVEDADGGGYVGWVPRPALWGVYQWESGPL